MPIRSRGQAPDLFSEKIKDLIVCIVILVLGLYEADGAAGLALGGPGLQLCQGGADSIELGTGGFIA